MILRRPLVRPALHGCSVAAVVAILAAGCTGPAAPEPQPVQSAPADPFADVRDAAQARAALADQATAALAAWRATMDSTTDSEARLAGLWLHDQYLQRSAADPYDPAAVAWFAERAAQPIDAWVAAYRSRQSPGVGDTSDSDL